MNMMKSMQKRFWVLMTALMLSLPAIPVMADLTDIASTPLSTSSGTAVRPNMMFVLDDSGSMGWNFMPDYLGYSLNSQDNNKCRRYVQTGTSSTNVTKCAGGTGASSNGMGEGGDPPIYSYQVNTIYYDPGIRYMPPVNPCNVSENLPSQTSATSVREDGLKIDSSCNQTSSTRNITTTYPERVYCDVSGSGTLTALSKTSGSGQYMCKRNGVDHIGAATTDHYDYPNTNISGTNYWYSGTAASMGTYRFGRDYSSNPHYYKVTPREHCKDATLVECKISTIPDGDFKEPAYVRFCNTDAQASSSTVQSGSGKCQATFDRTSGTTYTYARYGTFERVDIKPSVTSYPKATGRTDCAGATCTYTEEITNFANWYAYYRTRMQTMKTAAGRAFSTVDNSFRIGYLTIKPTTDPDKADSGVTASKYLKIDEFDPSHKEAWYKKLYAAGASGGTPLRVALSRVGRHFGGVTSGINKGMSDDPVQYACQQNFTLLTTDGYWNGNAGQTLAGGSIGNQDNVNSGYSKRSDGAYDGDLPGSSNTLADVALYYYKTDLRSSLANKVPTSDKDFANHQHMTTFTLGLGLDGRLAYSEDYETSNSGDFAKIKLGTLNWPSPTADAPTALDDLWHAAVNGRGKYFSAENPNSLVAGLQSALAGVNTRTGASAAAATSSQNITETDNFIFSTTYRSVAWDGEVTAKEIDPQTGEVGDDLLWSAQSKLDSRGYAGRKIYKFSASGTNKLALFDWANLTDEQAFFNGKCSLLSQCPALDSDAQAIANSGEQLINFLRGQTTHEGDTDKSNKAFRNREHILGDTVNSSPAYERIPRYNFTDDVTPTYEAFKTSLSIQNRKGMLYVGANDGMLHAFNASSGAGGGEEAWAYIPKAVMPNLYKLADKNYGANHQYFVDGSPTTMDVYDSGSWKTILVSSMNSGGRGYFALDITNENEPKALWEFCHSAVLCAQSDPNMGYGYGNAVIAKLPVGHPQAGKWVAILTSGYNNVAPGDGKGYIYIRDLMTGALIKTIATGVGDVTTPSGLGKINGYADYFDYDATARWLYAGDLQGNLWRVNLESGGGALSKLIALGTSQPITTRPTVAKVPAADNDPVVFFGTGRYLGTSDLTNADGQSVYAIRDNGDVHSRSSLVGRTIAHGETSATISGSPMDWDSGGWYADLPASGERVNIDPKLAKGTLVVVSNIPTSEDACSIGGASATYNFNYETGLEVPGSSVFGKLNSANTVVGFVLIQLPDGRVKMISTGSDGSQTTSPVEINPSGGLSRRTGWRELVK
ncbi:Type IV pilus biogenesis factor PilY1 [Methylophilaceae bacterium]|nr:Type IV pilus biogenesis factor PilY1 [Methylophilaceae bacterium]